MFQSLQYFKCRGIGVKRIYVRKKFDFIDDICYTICIK